MQYSVTEILPALNGRDFWVALQILKKLEVISSVTDNLCPLRLPADAS